MKKLILILLVILIITTVFSGCQASENTDTDIPIGNMNVQLEDEDTPSHITEAETTTEKPIETTTVETTTEKVTETTTKAETTTKKETTTQKPTTTETPETTTKKAETTTKRAETTTKKEETTTKPAPTTTSHAHNWTAHYAERKVLVKEAWDEPIYETNWHNHTTPYVCETCGKVFGIKCDECGYVRGYSADESPTGNNAHTDMDMHIINTGHVYAQKSKSNENIPYEVFIGYEHHDAEYKTEKYIDYYTCSCGAKKES